MCVRVMKTAMTNFDIAAILPELRQHTIERRIHNVYQITEDAFLLKIHPGNLNLIIEPSKRIHLTKFAVRTPPKPSQLCMALRKHVRSAKIAAVEQPDFERIVFLELERQGERQRIIAELLPRGNVILTDHQNRVIVSSRYVRMKDRNILRGQVLRLPPPRGKNLLQAARDDFTELRKVKGIDAVKAFAQVFGVSGIFAEEVLQRADVSKTTPAEDLTDEELERTSRAVNELREALSSGPRSPSIILDKNEMIDVIPFELERYKGMEKKTFASFNDAIDEYFTTLSSSEHAEEREHSFIEKRKQLERRLETQKSQLEEMTSSARMLRTKGDLVFRHLNKIRDALEIVLNAKRSKKKLEEITADLLKKNAEGARVYPYFVKMDPPGEKVNFLFDETEIEAEVRRRPQDQAADYYDKAKRLESKLAGLLSSIRETELLLGKLAAKEVELTQPAAPELPPEREWFEKFRWFNSSEGMLVIGGRDAASNELVLKRYTGTEDLVMHAEVHGAPFFVVKAGASPLKDETLREAAQACVSYSRLWKEGIRSGDAYWVKPEQVTKSAPAGEYLTKGAFMIRGTRNYLRGIELALAVGLTSRGNGPKLMAGPPTAVRNRCSVYVEMRQGRESPAKAARKILSILGKETDASTRVALQRIGIDDVIRLLPPGGVEIANSISP